MSYREKLVTVDKEKLLKEVTVIEGGPLNCGLTSFIIRYEIFKKSQDSSTLKTTIEFEVPDELAESATHIKIDSMAAMIEGAYKVLLEEKKSNEGACIKCFSRRRNLPARSAEVAISIFPLRYCCQ